MAAAAAVTAPEAAAVPTAETAAMASETMAGETMPAGKAAVPGEAMAPAAACAAPAAMVAAMIPAMAPAAAVATPAAAPITTPAATPTAPAEASPPEVTPARRIAIARTGIIGADIAVAAIACRQEQGGEKQRRRPAAGSDAAGTRAPREALAHLRS